MSGCLTGNTNDELQSPLCAESVRVYPLMPQASTDPHADRMLLILIMSTIAAGCGIACLIILISFL